MARDILKTEKKVIYEHIQSINCDICNRHSIGECFSEERFEVSEVIVSIEEGTCYPETGNKTRMEWDICPKCFKEKIR